MKCEACEPTVGWFSAKLGELTPTSPIVTAAGKAAA
jgi:hypothetical protein